MSNFVLVIIAAVLLLPGVAMAVLPVPSILYMFIVVIVFGVVDHFVHLSAWDIVWLAIFSAVVMLVEFLSGVIGAKWAGAHWSSILWGVAGLLIGSLVIPVPIFGSLAGMFIGVLLSEWYRTNDIRKANKAATGSFLGWLAGTGFKILASIVFLVLFIILVLV